ncbi:DUF4959 domain-containing protein [Niabella drilacis]|uniref:DUF4959 domain-containing protein n=1 Tax=Niabella drilacis (strain DSM 25811 / CCM 8410 / CCUG 62505 / LMG 26954 / E90) TaxID=1285928 RepID=A0A1G7A5L6_NIADE|nr:DUF5000 domain-containing lipoprotein [Niabella drilacis]SDE10092.1 protein of unknown function [Niabella drilacis]
MRSAYFILLFFTVAGLSSCKQELLNTPVEKGGARPGTVSNIMVQNTNGASTLTYTLPAAPDLLYIKAVYEIRPGIKREVVSSYYNNTMTVDGFAKAGAYEVQLYAVTRSHVESDPVAVTVTPLESPVNLAFRSLKTQAGFGGPNIKVRNAAEQPIVIVPMIDSLGNGNYESLDKIYTQADSINYTIRGLQDKPTRFAFCVSDRFGNSSDTLYEEITPLAEVILDKTRFSEFTLPGDGPLAYANEGVAVRLIWDNNYNLNAVWPRLYTNVSNTNIQTITWSIGVAKTLSRMKIYPRSENNDRYYEQGNLRDFEIWGSANPTLDGSYDASWVKLAAKSIVRPSGLPYGQPSSAEDIAYAKAGWDVEFEPGQPPVKYLRIRNIRNWQGFTNIWISQVDIWGSK